MIHCGVHTGEIWAYQYQGKTESRPMNGTQSSIVWSILYSFYFGGFIVGATVMAISLEFLGSKNTIILTLSLEIIKWISALISGSTVYTEISIFFV